MKKIEHFPKIVERFLDKKCDKQRNLEPHFDSIEMRKAIVSILPLFALASCAIGPIGGNLIGDIICENCADIPKNAEVKVELLDTALQDAPAKILSHQIINGPQKFPIRYKLHYWDSQMTIPEFTSVSVTIHHEGKLIYSTDFKNTPFLYGKKMRYFDVKVVKVN